MKKGDKVLLAATVFSIDHDGKPCEVEISTIDKTVNVSKMNVSGSCTQAKPLDDSNPGQDQSTTPILD